MNSHSNNNTSTTPAGVAAQNLDRAASQVSLILRSPLHKGKYVVLVEGEYDKRFYQKFFNPSLAVFLPQNTCNKVRRTASWANGYMGGKYKLRMMGIVDSDFLSLDGIPEDEVNLFRTDWHDHEAWVITKPGSLQTVCNGYLTPPYPAASLLQEAYKGIENLSFIKWRHFQLKRADYSNPKPLQKQGLDFGDSPMNLYFGKSIADSLSNLHQSQDNLSGRLTLDESDVTNFKQANAATDPRMLHVGHDVLHAIDYRIKQIKIQNIKDKAIYKKLCDLYTPADFQSTGLHAAIRQYMAANSLPSPLL